VTILRLDCVSNRKVHDLGEAPRFLQFFIGLSTKYQSGRSCMDIFLSEMPPASLRLRDELTGEAC
jgi:hypothetical protein